MYYKGTDETQRFEQVQAERMPAPRGFRPYSMHLT